MGDTTHIISFKISESEKQALEDYCHNRVISKSAAIRDFVRKGLEGFEIQTESESGAIHDLYQKIEAIEQRINAGYTKPDPLPQTIPAQNERYVDCAVFDIPEGDAILSKDDISRKWGYTISTLGSKMSRDKLKAVCKIWGNKAAMYLQSDIIQKWGAPLYD